MSDHNNFGAFMVGLVIGGLTGGVVALLFAPQSGEETRIMIKDRSIELRDKAQQSSQDALARADELVRQFKEQGQNAVEAVRDQDISRSASEPDGPAAPV